MKTSLSMCRRERLALRTALELAGFLVFEVSEAGRDRDRLRNLWAALILLDFHTPRMRGLEVVRGLRSAGGDSPEAIVIMHGPIPDALTEVRLGAADVLAKPLSSEALCVVVHDVLRPAAGSRTDPARPSIFVAVEPLVLDLLQAKRALDSREFDENDQTSAYCPGCGDRVLSRRQHAATKRHSPFIEEGPVAGTTAGGCAGCLCVTIWA